MFQFLFISNVLDVLDVLNVLNILNVNIIININITNASYISTSIQMCKYFISFQTDCVGDDISMSMSISVLMFAFMSAFMSAPDEPVSTVVAPTCS